MMNTWTNTLTFIVILTRLHRFFCSLQLRRAASSYVVVGSGAAERRLENYFLIRSRRWVFPATKHFLFCFPNFPWEKLIKADPKRFSGYPLIRAVHALTHCCYWTILTCFFFLHFSNLCTFQLLVYIFYLFTYSAIRLNFAFWFYSSCLFTFSSICLHFMLWFCFSRLFTL